MSDIAGWPDMEERSLSVHGRLDFFDLDQGLGQHPGRIGTVAQGAR